MLSYRYVAVLALGVLACTGDAKPAAERSLSLAAFTGAAEQCVQRSGGRADSLAATCSCHALKAQLDNSTLRCYASPHLLGFVGEDVPLPPIHRSHNAYYGLAFAPRGLDLGVTEEREVFTPGYGVASADAGLPPRWYLVTYCQGCD